LIGDSHGRAYFHGLKEAFPEINFVVFERGGCSFFSTRYVSFADKTSHECDNARATAFAEITQQPSRVLLAQRWLWYSTRSHFSKDGRISFSNEESFSNFVSDEIKNLRRVIEASGSTLTVFGAVPGFRVVGSPLDCVTRPIKPATCQFTSVGDPAVSHNRVFDQRLGAALGSGFINPFDILCDETRCRNFDDTGQSVYSDADHLSIWGSSYVVMQIRDTLMPLRNPGG
jgi:hypothetical protein